MSVLSKLATALNRKDEIPNVALAEEIVRKNDAGAVSQLVANLYNRDKNIQSDCIKVLYEIGQRDPKLIATIARYLGNCWAVPTIDLFGVQ